MITITHPTVTEGTVEVSGLTFVNGKAEVASFDDPAAVAVLTEHGFTFDGEPEQGDEEVVGVKLEKLSRADIDSLAAELGIDVSGAKNKAEAISIIEASPAVPVIGDAEQADSQAPTA